MRKARANRHQPAIEVDVIPRKPKQLTAALGQSGVARTRARTAKQLDRQEKAFVLSVVDGLSTRAIAKQLRVDRKTVQSDVRFEAERRAEEIEQRRATEQAMQVTRLDHLFRRGMELAKTPGAGGLSAAAKSLEMRARLLGLDRVDKKDDVMDKLLQALDGNYDE